MFIVQREILWFPIKGINSIEMLSYERKKKIYWIQKWLLLANQAIYSTLIFFSHIQLP